MNISKTARKAIDDQSEFDDKSEKWQEGERGQAAQEWIGTLDTLVDTLDCAIDAEQFPDFDEVDNLTDQPEN